MIRTLLNIEDCLEAAAGLHHTNLVTIDNSDKTIMHSIARQVFKGTALTDKQFALMQEKLTKYKDQFENLDCDFEFIITQLRQPLRQIDRSKYIKVIDDEIKVRFPFKKSLIICVNAISNHATFYRHDKGSHSHYFTFNDRNIDLVLDQFIDKDFDIDEVVKVLKESPGLIVLDDPAENKYPMPLNAQGKDEVFVGRIRRDYSADNTLNLWIVADNLRKGAATNAVQIAEHLVQKGWVLSKV